MDKTVTDILKEAAKDVLTDEVLKDIETSFNAAVDSKVKIHVEKALLEQDADYSAKLEKLIEAIDADHTKKLEKVVEALDADRAEKLKAVVEKYSKNVNDEASSFKSDLVNSISNYLELYLDEKVPSSSINEAVNNKRAMGMITSLRSALAVDMALAKESIKEAVVDGKNQISEAAEQLKAANTKVDDLTKELNKLRSELTLEKSIVNLPDEKKSYMKKLLGGKSAQFIKENFDYTLGLFEKTEEERINNLKSEALNQTVADKVDSPAATVVTESVSTNTDADPSFNAYMSELKKY